MKIEAENKGTKWGKAKSAGWFVAGTLVGVILGGTMTYHVEAQPYQNAMADTAALIAMNNVYTALQSRKGRSTEIVKRVETQLPVDVLLLDYRYKSHPMTERALRTIRFYYQKNNIPIPANIQPILSAVPK